LGFGGVLAALARLLVVSGSDGEDVRLDDGSAGNDSVDRSGRAAPRRAVRHVGMDWSPDGRWLLLGSYKAGGTAITAIDTHNGSVYEIPASPFAANAWSIVPFTRA
jgi:hypothetical protein